MPIHTAKSWFAPIPLRSTPALKFATSDRESPQTTATVFFVPFQQLGHEGAAATGQGAGLGLAIVDRIVALHGGELLVDSLLGRGTSIHVLLPFEQSPRRSK